MAAPNRDVLDREYLPTRAKILEIAATLDRIDRSRQAADSDPRLSQLRSALELVLQADSNRAEKVQILFSRAYDESWQTTFALVPRASQS